jgi:ABC-type nitrate/sulfonate/bicarbonate transport system substrate-binding protein
VPHEYFPLLFTTSAFVTAEPETVAAVVRATARGYAYAARHPAASADLFLRSVPHNRLPKHADELVHRSMAWLAPRLNGTLAGQPLAAPWGWHDPVQWAAFASFIRRLADAYQLTPPEPEAESQGYTNAFIPRD